MTTGRLSFERPKNISPIAFVNTYVFGHPYTLALIIKLEKPKATTVREVQQSF
jgi:hypothetical protein